jgi:RNA polymerase sigma-70 factor (ECF subfamily)
VNATSLLLRCREGDSLALNEFTRRYQPVVERLALTLLDDGRAEKSVEVEDVRGVVQDTLLAAVAAGEQFRDEADLSLWIYATGLKACQRRLRRRGHLPRASSAEAPGSMRTAVRQLDEKLRLPLLLHYSSGLSLAEVARVLKLSRSTIEARMVAAREKVRVLLEDR